MEHHPPHPPNAPWSPPPVPAPQPPRLSFRWGWVLAPAALLVGIWFWWTGGPGITWGEVLNILGIVERDAFSRLTALATVLTGMLMLLKLWQKR